ncbi:MULTISPECIES: hypothetical protein [Halorussus]|nr:hypothetical protein [Halorussus vallis]USZ77485.1 hypothetical protein NGM07_09155 [Halorussus vallis]
MGRPPVGLLGRNRRQRAYFAATKLAPERLLARPMDGDVSGGRDRSRRP